MSFAYRWIRPLLFCLDAERAHRLAITVGRGLQRLPAPLLAPFFGHRDVRLEQLVWGLRFANPVGLAAGFDKNALLPRLFQTLGMGAVEVGSVSARPAPGNPRPRAFRLAADGALINRMGLNNDGAKLVARRLRRVRPHLRIPLGVNIAKTHDAGIVGDLAIHDFVDSFRRLAPFADYIAVNISCPNTREGKTFEEPAALDTLLAAIMAERDRIHRSLPVLVKLSPPPPQGLPDVIDEMIEICESRGVAGYIASNTAPDRHHLHTDPQTVAAIGNGGLSGTPLQSRSTRLIRHVYRKTGGASPIIGVGGIACAADAYAKIRAGASLVQVYTGLVYEGPGLIRAINRGLVKQLETDRISTIHDAVGLDA